MKINNLVHFILNKIKLFSFKLSLKSRLVIGNKPQFKNTSRINIWGKEGKIIVGDNFSMGFNSELYSWNDCLSIGRETSLNDNCKIYGNVYIGANCLFASNIFISSGTHNFSYNPYLPIKQQDKLQSVSKGVVVEDDCWLGFGVVVMPGVYIGKGAIIGSNTVVTKDVFPYTINAGIPNREIGKRLEFNNSHDEINCNNAEHWPFFYRGCNYNQFDDLNTLKDGIEIIDSTAVFLVSKGLTNQIRIKGFTDYKIKLKIFVNKYHFRELQVNAGSFDINLSLVFQELYYPNVFNRLSDDIISKFDIIVVETYTHDGEEFNKEMWKILSIGYNEN
ncbi:MAG: acyltransferase [Flavobacterium sp.]